MGFLDKLLGRGKKAASEVGEMADKVGDKIEDLTDRDEKKDAPATPPPPPPPAPSAPPPAGSAGGGGGGGTS